MIYTVKVPLNHGIKMAGDTDNREDNGSKEANQERQEKAKKKGKAGGYKNG